MENLVNQNTSDYRYGPKGTYKRSIIDEVVLQLEAGMSYREISVRYGIPGGTLREWGEKYGDSSKIFIRKAFTKVQKRSIARSVIEGSLTVKEASKANGVSRPTIKDWVEKEKHELCTPNAIVLKKAKKQKVVDPPAPAENEIKTLQKQLAHANLRIAALNTLIDVAEEQLNINIRKKPGAKQS